MLTHERRQQQRIPVLLDAKYRDQDAGQESYRIAEFMDISFQGCCLQGGVSFKRGQPVSIQVDLPFEETFYMRGIAAWSAPVYKDRLFSTGVRFVIDDEESEEKYSKLFNFCLLNMPRN